MKKNNNFKKLQFNVVIVIFGLMNFFGFCSQNQEINYPDAYFPDSVTNLSSINSEFDEFNPGPPPTVDGELNLYYSSNKKSNGNNFDILGTNLRYEYNQNNGKFYISAYQLDNYYSFSKQLELINSPANELGPNFNYHDSTTNYLFFTSDKGGILSIYCLFNEFDSTKHEYIDSDLFPINILNSSMNDGYLTIHLNGNNVYFMSDRKGNFDIYKRAYPPEVELKKWIMMTSASFAEQVVVLNSTGNDKCPYINGNLIVFTSDRAGGFGGFDLWYSIFSNGTWSSPVNFGNKINSEFDEYRPVVVADTSYKNDMMIFSSNRPGGKGGYDLYFVGIPKMTK